jgi:hypothetical protein
VKIPLAHLRVTRVMLRLAPERPIVFCGVCCGPGWVQETRPDGAILVEHLQMTYPCRSRRVTPWTNGDA